MLRYTAQELKELTLADLATIERNERAFNRINAVLYALTLQLAAEFHLSPEKAQLLINIAIEK